LSKNSEMTNFKWTQSTCSYC